MKRFHFLYTALSLLCIAASAQNDRTVGGKVVDRSGQAIAGASVIVEGTAVGASGDAMYFLVSRL